MTTKRQSRMPRAKTFIQFILLLTLCGCQETTSQTPTMEGDAGRPGTDAGPNRPIGDLPTFRFNAVNPPHATPLGHIPFPNNILLQDGHLDLQGVPQQTQGSILERMVEALEVETPGFGTNATMYLSFETPIEALALPEDGASSVSPDSSLQLVDIDPGSAEQGRRWPITWRVVEGETLYLPANTLAVRLVPGFPLRPNTTYALLVTQGAAQSTDNFEAMLDDTMPTDESLAPLWPVYEPLRAFLAAEAELSLGGATVFTTQDPTTELFTVRDYVHTLPIPVPANVESEGLRQNKFELFVGQYTAPRFQEGAVPYEEQGTGAFRFEADGTPIVQGEETLRFALSIPIDREMPESGWPVVLYGHGTGGNFKSFIRSRVAANLAQVGLAVLSIDQIHHGPRDPRPDGCHERTNPDACVALLFFNFVVPTAGRDNVRQSAIDLVSLLRLAQNFDLQVPPLAVEMDAAPEEPAEMDSGMEADPAQSDAGVSDNADAAMEADAGVDDNADAAIETDAGAMPEDPAPSEEPRALRLDPARIMYMGHSQGGLNGPLFLAVEPNLRGGVLSAAGGDFAISLEQKREPFDINALVHDFIPLNEGDSIDRWHPVVALLQTFIEPGDPVNYARFWFAEPAPGHQAKSILMTAGLEDLYTPPDAILSLAAAGSVPVVEPVHTPIEAHAIRGVESAGVPPYSGNVANGECTAGVAQFPNLGHFVIQQSVSARNRYRLFLESLTSGLPTIY